MSNRPRIEPNADIRQAAHATRQIFISFKETGFTDAEALALTISAMNQKPGGTQ